MQFYGKITVYRYAEDNWNPEITEIFAEHFEAKSIQAAKANAHKNRKRNRVIFVDTVLGQRETHLHRERSAMEDLGAVHPPPISRTTASRSPISTRMSDRESGETVYPEGYTYGKICRVPSGHRRALEVQR